MDNIIRWKQVESLSIVVCNDKTLYVDNDYTDRYTPSVKHGFGPLLYFSKVSSFSTSPHDCIQAGSMSIWQKNNIPWNSKLYISPKSKVPRDLLRNSGYSITYSMDKAEYLVLPAPKTDEKKRVVSAIVLNNSTGYVYLCDVENIFTTYNVPADDILNIVAKHESLSVDDLEIFTLGDTLPKIVVWYTNDVPEFEKILRGEKLPAEYLFDNQIPIMPSNNLSVETLDLWKRLIQKDWNLFEKAAINSDAKEYPLTFATFLLVEGMSNYYWSQQFKWFLTSMKINDYGLYDEENISVKDMDMLSDWICHILSIDGKYGFVDEKSYVNLHWRYKKFVKSKIAASPVRIANPMKLKNIKN